MSSHRPSEEKRAHVIRLWGEGGVTERRITRLTGLHWLTVRRILREAGLKTGPRAKSEPTPKSVAPPAGTVATAAPQPPPDPIEEERRRLDRNREMQRERDLVKAIAGERSFRSFLESLMLDVAPRIEAPPCYRPPEPGHDVSTETLLAVWSDWHAYEVVRSERVLGLNEYDGMTMSRRVKRVVDSSLQIKHKMERGGGWRFPNLAVACNGDFVSGTIHEVERHSDARNIIHAVYGTGMTMALALRDMSPHFERIDVYCTSGNHGRLPDARRMQSKDPTRNWDTVVYLYAMTALRDVPNVHFHIPDSYVVMYEIEGWRFLQTHGHDIKSWNSIPYYGIDRYGRNINALMTANEMPINYFVVSHFHSLGGVPSAGGETFINGSIIGGTEFSVNALGKSDRPKQWMFQVHRKIGVSARWPVLGDGGDGEGYPPVEWNSWS